MYDSNCFGVIPEKSTHYRQGTHYKKNSKTGGWFKFNGFEWVNARGIYLCDYYTYDAIKKRDDEHYAKRVARDEEYRRKMTKRGMIKENAKKSRC